MPGFVQPNATQPHVAYLNRRNCDLAGIATMQSRYSYDLPIGVLRQRRQTADCRDSGATRDTMPALFDDGADATIHHLRGRGRVDFLRRNRSWFFWQLGGQGNEHLGVLAYFGIHADGSTMLAHNVAGYGET